MKFNFSDDNYVNTEEKLLALDAHLMDGDKPKFGLLAFDTETNGLYFHKNVIIGFSISTDSSSGFYIPLLEWQPDLSSLKSVSIQKKKQEVYQKGYFKDVWSDATYPEDVSGNEYQPPEFIVGLLRSWLETPKVKLIMHNAPFDCNMIKYHFNVDLAQNLFVDTILLKHVLDENTRHGLKETATQWSYKLGFNANEDAKREQLKLGQSIIKNGGTFNSKTKEVWRGDPLMVAKYGASDTALTFGLYEVGMQMFEDQYTPKHVKWFFEDEVMPVCKEVVIPMRYWGVYIDVPYFENLKAETQKEMDRIEDQIQLEIKDLISDFNIGLSMEEAVSEKRLVEKFIELENLEYPTQIIKGEIKKSLAKKPVQAAYAKDPHWVWGYLLGLENIKYSPVKLNEIKTQLYVEAIERRYRFNIRSADHLRWLFCKKLKHDQYKLPQTDSATKDNPIPSMAAEVLEEHFIEHSFVRSLLTFKKLDKLLGTYIFPALELHNNGWLHMDMKQHGTVSGRFSCSGGFNLQTLPKVEELDRCSKCDSKKVKVSNSIKLLASVTCSECGNVKESVLCPSAIKAGFIAPPGQQILNADYQALEPRCFSYMSGDPKLKQVYKDGLDIYSKVYIDMLDHEGKYSAHPDDPNFLKKLNKSARDLFKPVVLGIPYGSRDSQVANLMDLRVKKRVKNYEGEFEEKEFLDVAKGKEYRDLYLETYPKLKEYMELRELEAITKGHVETIIGRRRHFEYAPFIYQLISESGVSVEEFLDARGKDMAGESAMNGRLKRTGLYQFGLKYNIPYHEILEREAWIYIRNLFKNELNNAKNVPIQGLAGHITNRAMLDMTRLMKTHGIEGYVCLQVHDEITVYAEKEKVKQAQGLLKIAMENNQFALQLDVPMEANPIICDNLKDSK
jgi:DNA polymerase I-like protein with 3'-5' exonuclease and polymerase domains